MTSTPDNGFNSSSGCSSENSVGASAFGTVSSTLTNLSTNKPSTNGHMFNGLQGRATEYTDPLLGYTDIVSPCNIHRHRPIRVVVVVVVVAADDDVCDSENVVHMASVTGESTVYFL